MKILFFCPKWGLAGMRYPEFLKKAIDAGFDGVEMSLPLDNLAKQAILQQIKESGLQYIAQHHETLDSDFNPHKLNFRKRLYNLASANPLFINSQTGKDYFTFDQNVELLNMAQSISEETGVKIVHETHRGKFSFALHVTQKFLQELPWLRLTLDMSHWCNVSESLLKDQQEAMDLAISRTEHIHARIGYSEGPQINDPRAPEWEEAKEAHLLVWDRVVKNLNDTGKDITIMPEFGPYPYMVEMPFTRQPIANQWEVNVYMKNLLKGRYQKDS